ncbi:MAG: DUF460 domain-containing protein [Halobacteriota archaeon]
MLQTSYDVIGAGRRCDTISSPKHHYTNFASSKKMYTIVGVDPGTTTAFAVMDLNGQLINVASSRTWDFSELIGLLIERGHPLIIAADKTPVPSNVERVKRAFNAILWVPPASLSVEQKVRATRSIAHANDHERDALAAALEAWRSVKNKLETVEKRAPEDVDVDELKMLVLRGHTIEAAVRLLQKPLADVERETKREAPTQEKDLLGPDIHYFKAIIKRQDDQIARLLSYVSELKESLQLGHEQLSKLQDKLNFIQSQRAHAIKLDKEITLRQKEIDRLSEELARSRRTNRSLNKRIKKLKLIGTTESKSSLKAVTIVSSFNRDAIEAADQQFGLHGSIVLLEDASGGGTAAADILVDKSVRAIIVTNEMSDAAQKKFLEADIPVLPMTELPLELFGGLMTVDKDALDYAIKRSKKQMSEVKQFEALRRLESLIEAYKHQRATSSQRNG